MWFHRSASPFAEGSALAPFFSFAHLHVLCSDFQLCTDWQANGRAIDWRQVSVAQIHPPWFRVSPGAFGGWHGKSAELYVGFCFRRSTAESICVVRTASKRRRQGLIDFLFLPSGKAMFFPPSAKGPRWQERACAVRTTPTCTCLGAFTCGSGRPIICSSLFTTLLSLSLLPAQGGDL